MFKHSDWLQESALLIDALARELTARGFALSTAESCTGGMIAARCTDFPGSSAWFTGGAVSYANIAKERVLNVSPALLETEGAVSEAVVIAMARGAQQLFTAQCAVAVSGIAGPDGGSPEKPVGTVWIAVACEETLLTSKHLFPGSRHDVRAATVKTALQEMLALLQARPA